MNNDDHDAGFPEGLDLRALSAFVDGELPAGRRAAIEAQLAQHPQAAARVAAWRAQTAALRVLCGAPRRSAWGEPGEHDEASEHDDLDGLDEAGERSDLAGFDESDEHHRSAHRNPLNDAHGEPHQRNEGQARVHDAERNEGHVRAYGTERNEGHVRAYGTERNEGHVRAYAAERSESHVHSRASERNDTDEPAFILIRRPTPWWQRVGLAACWLAAGAGLTLALGPLAPHLTGGAWGGFGAQPPGFAQRADVAYAVYTPERRHPVEVAASDEEHLINWLSKRLNRPLSVPSLQEYGYSLVGGRLLPGEAGPAAQFMYENSGGARLTLYVTGAARDETAFRLFRDGDRRTFYWISDGMGYALSGAIAEGKLRSMAIDVCSELGGKPEAWQ
jgi:anti-sigma factor RsiW